MTSEENIKEKLEELAQAIRPDETFIKNVMSRINASPIADPSIGPAQNIWRTIMKNPITKSAAAAVIIIACFTGLHFWKSTGSGIALADVLTRIEQVTGYMYQMSSTTTTRQGATTNSTSTVLISQDHGVRVIRQGIDPNNGEIQDVSTLYILRRQNSRIRIDHGKKTYTRIEFKDATTENHEEEDNDPRTMIKQFLSCDHTSLGQSVIDGVTVEGFQTTDPAYKGSFSKEAALFGPRREKVDGKIWVDVNTFLPVRSEEDIISRKGRHMHHVTYDYRWNVVVNPDDFEPNIPEDYRGKGDIIVPATDEENAIKGLRLFADAVGKYPSSCMAIAKEYESHTEFDPNSYMDLSNEEKNRKMSELISLVTSRYFYKYLVKDNKDPVYNGETVKPGDADKVLLRWKLEDGQYRVIFGDLHVDTVTADVMIEMEMTLPK